MEKLNDYDQTSVGWTSRYSHVHSPSYGSPAPRNSAVSSRRHRRRRPAGRSLHQRDFLCPRSTRGCICDTALG